MTEPTVASLLERHAPDLRTFVRAHAGSSLDHESEDDLTQGVQLRMLSRADSFTYRSEPEFRAWMFRVARAYLADRHDYWTAAKRLPDRLLRLTDSPRTAGADGAAAMPARDTAGPATRADQREALQHAERALAMLPPRDAALVRGHADGISLEDQAEQLGLSYAAAQKARLRALERFRKAFRIVSRAR